VIEKGCIVESCFSQTCVWVGSSARIDYLQG
jgi:hypothetical protein